MPMPPTTTGSPMSGTSGIPSSSLSGILGGMQNSNMMKKGGAVKKYTSGGKINLDACSVSTHTKSKSSPNW